MHIIPILTSQISQNVTGFEKTWPPHTIMNTNVNYLKYYNSGREIGACMKFATIILAFIMYLSSNYWVNN